MHDASHPATDAVGTSELFFSNKSVEATVVCVCIVLGGEIALLGVVDLDIAPRFAIPLSDEANGEGILLRRLDSLDLLFTAETLSPSVVDPISGVPAGEDVYVSINLRRCDTEGKARVEAWDVP